MKQRSAQAHLTDLTTWLRDKHKDAGDGRCLEDAEDWPCPTIQAVWRAEAPRPRGRKAYHIEIADDDAGALEGWLTGRSAVVVDVMDIESGRPAGRRS